MDKVWWLYVGIKAVGGIWYHKRKVVVPVITTRNLKGVPMYQPLGQHKTKSDAERVAIEKGFIYKDGAGNYRFTPDGVKHFI